MFTSRPEGPFITLGISTGLGSSKGPASGISKIMARSERRPTYLSSPEHVRMAMLRPYRGERH